MTEPARRIGTACVRCTGDVHTERGVEVCASCGWVPRRGAD